MTILFAIDGGTEEVIISGSAKGSRTITFMERIARRDNEMLYRAVHTLTAISQAPDLDVSLFKAMDKVCGLIYAKHKGG